MEWGDGEVQDSKGILNLEACIDETHVEPRRAKRKESKVSFPLKGAVQYISRQACVCLCVTEIECVGETSMSV